MISQSLVDAVEWVLNVTVCTSVLFPAVTSFFWPWWQTGWGRNLIALDLALVPAVLPEVLEIDFGLRYVVFFTWVQVIGLSAIILIMAWRTVMIWRAQRSGAAGQDPQYDGKPSR